MIKGIDLHTHLEGSIPLRVYDFLREKYDLQNIENSEIDWLQNFSPIFGMYSRTLKTPEDFELATREFLIDQYKSGVIYTEFRIAPYHHVILWNVSISELIWAVINGIHQAYEEVWSVWRVIIEAARQYGYEHVKTVYERMLEYYDPNVVVGFGIGGVEKDWDMEQYEDLLTDLWKRNIPISLHAGENGSVNNLLFALSHPGVRRVGHALSYPFLPDVVKKKINKLVEVCITSNLKLGYVKDVSEHPVINMYHDDISLAICTDDTTIFNTSLPTEIKMAEKLLEILPKKISQIYDVAMEYAFCDANTKNKIKESLVI